MVLRTDLSRNTSSWLSACSMVDNAAVFHRIGVVMASSAPDSPVWFITGCSSGFGREFARAALAHGFRVVATAREVRKLDDLIAGHEARALPLALDVTNAEQIKRAISQAENAFGRIDVLVNNAGYGYMAAVEEGEDKDIRAIFETNFFGMAAMIRAVLPGMRARRHGSIVNIASVGGIIGLPGSGYYAATKFAVEGLSESLAWEVEPLGIRVLLVEPGPFRTDWAGRSLRQSPNFIGDYEQTSGRRRREIAGYNGKQPGDPARAAEVVIKVLQAPAPPAHLVLGREGLDHVERQLKSTLNELDHWRLASLSADFPAA
jgi:NAD(P)-dependent dehydrogenase (short-subunit alcohol dehydrogenase family)